MIRDPRASYSRAQGEPPPGYEGPRQRIVGRPPGVPVRSPDACPHEHLQVRADVNRIVADGLEGEAALTADPIAFDLEIALDCIACSTPFHFMGLPIGLSPAHPTSSLDGMTMTAPMRPAGSPPGFGLNRPGYSINVYTEDK